MPRLCSGTPTPAQGGDDSRRAAFGGPLAPVPILVQHILQRLHAAGYSAHLVGGCVRDRLLHRPPHDWDVATAARPQEVLALFPHSVPTGVAFGTVTVFLATPEGQGQDLGQDQNQGRTEGQCEDQTQGTGQSKGAGQGEGKGEGQAQSQSEGHSQAQGQSEGHSQAEGRTTGKTSPAPGEPPVQVTTYRREMGSRDQRHPETVVFSDTVTEDLVRRDFTINALAYDPWRDQLIDPAGGQADLARRLIRAVGNPDERFREDALRPLRAVRLASELRPFGFRIEPQTRSAIRRHAPAIAALSHERVRDELLRLLGSPDPQWGLWELEDLGLLFRIVPELAAARDFPQDKPGIPTLLDHLIRTTQHVPPDPVLRLAALLHDVAKPATVMVAPGGQVHFYGHDVQGAEMAERIGATLRLSRPQINRISSLIRMHMVNGPEVGKKALRRWLGQYGEGWIRDLFALRRADFIASGFSPAEPNPFIDQLEDWLDEVLAERSALRASDLALNGNQVMNELGLHPGPLVGEALAFLLEQVLEEPSLNTPTSLRQLLHQWWQQQGLPPPSAR